MNRATFRSIAVSLALCAMVLRALLPDGWMPAANAAEAGTPFVICSVDGAHHGKAPGDTQQRTHAPCAFAAAAPLSPPSTGAVVVRALGVVTFVARSVEAALPARTSGYRPNAARAPPASV
ncbi:MAG TPA: hypothetical protein VMU08_07680 [Rhizomicrobium sp.]|nr:hypothetical protein [Rhizomicrobium sp.]